MEFLEINQVQGYLCYWLENVSLAEGKTAKKKYRTIQKHFCEKKFDGGYS